MYQKKDHNGRFFALMQSTILQIDFMGCSVGLVKDKDS